MGAAQNIICPSSYLHVRGYETGPKAGIRTLPLRDSAGLVLYENFTRLPPLFDRLFSYKDYTIV